MRGLLTGVITVALAGLVACDGETVVVTEYEVITVTEQVIVPDYEVITVTETIVQTVTEEVIPPCGPTQPQGACDAGETCFGGACVETATLCSPSNLDGICAAGFVCFTGGCVLENGLCGPSNPAGPCELGNTCVEGDCIPTASLCSSTNLEGACPAGQECTEGQCAEPAVDPCTVHVNTTQPTIGIAADFLTAEERTMRLPVTEVPAVTKLTVDGLTFKDHNRNGALDPFEDWRLSDACRAKDLLTEMTLEQKIGTMSEGSRHGNGSYTAEGMLQTSTITNIRDLHRRYSLIRLPNSTPAALATYHNAVQALAEAQPLAIPMTITADPVHGIGLSTNATSGVQTLSLPSMVSPWPYPLGLGAINDRNVSRRYGDVVRHEFMGMGMRWQLGPMVDSATEPRWARVQNTLGENAFAVAIHGREVIEGFQGAGDGGMKNGIAATMKHFPTAGPAESGMDSHTYPGRYNVFPGGYFDYHLVPFQAAIDAGAAAVMPCYSIFEGQTQWSPDQLASGFSHGLMTLLLKNEMGFDGMVTGDWGTLSNGYNFESLTLAQRASLWLKAGSHQFGSDNESNFKDAYDQGYVDMLDIDNAAFKILEMSFKLGVFENPYVDPAATNVRTADFRRDGFNAQKRAMVMLKNTTWGSGATQRRLLPIGGACAECDGNADNVMSIYFDGVRDNLVDNVAAPDYLTDILGEYDYTAPAAEGVRAITEATSITTADIAVLRISARKGVYFGLDNGVPLSFDKVFEGVQADSTLAPAVKDRNRVIDALRVKYGYVNAAGETVAPTNPTLKIVLVMHFDRPGIVEPFVKGLTNLNETLGQPGSYPLVSNPANTNPAGNTGVDAVVVEFGAVDRAVLDVLFNKNPIEGFPYFRARLPMEVPSTDLAVEENFEDVPADTFAPTYRLGAGSNTGY